MAQKLVKYIRSIVLYIVLIAAFAKANTTKAQAFEKGDHTFSAGYGFAELIADNTNMFEWQVAKYSSNTGPFYFKMESALSNTVSAGINFNYGYFEQFTTGYLYGFPNNNPPYTYSMDQIRITDTYKVFNVVARIDWHYGDSNKFDPYLGFGLGYRIEDHVNSYSDLGTSYNLYNDILNSVSAELTIGVRYYLNDHLAVYGETGYSQSVVQFGLTYRLRKKNI